VKVCNEKKIPLFGGDLKCVTKGAMAAYGWDYFQIGHSAGRKAVRILKGEKPGDIPWEPGEKLILMINEKAAKTQGAIVSPQLLKKADKVIQ
jgi:putative ABC transport system substrate-binding protein